MDFARILIFTFFMLFVHCILCISCICFVFVSYALTLSMSGLSFMSIKICSVLLILVGFVALRPKSTALVIAGRSVHLTTLFPGQA